MKTVAVANHKGGSGKTTTTYNLGMIFGGVGVRTLVIDLDTQMNLTRRFYPDKPRGYTPGLTVANVLGGAAPGVDIREAIYPVGGDELYLCPSAFDLANVALGLLNDPIRGRTALRRALRPIGDRYDLCLLDCPPEAGIILANALVAADAVICPAEPERDALDGIQRVVEIVDFIQGEYGAERLTVLGSIATRVNLRTNLHHDGLTKMGQEERAPLLATIPARSGTDRDERLAAEYGPVAEAIRQWLGGQVC